MQLEYHYYLIHHLATLAGFQPDDAETVAYASQYVDDATEGDPVNPYGDQYFDPIRTAHYGLGCYDWDVQKKVYMPFHFLPARVRADNPRRFSYVTECATGAVSEPATQLIEAALSETDAQLRLIRLGIALHALADTFSHFGFSGRHNDENDVEQIRVKNKKRWQLQDLIWKFGDIVLPRIGHVEAFKLPDLPYMKWTYRDHAGTEHARDNLVSSIQGAEFIYGLLKMVCHPPADAATLRKCFASLKESSDFKKEQPQAFGKIRRLLKSQANEESRYAKWIELTQAREYERTRWRREALAGDVDWDRKSQAGIRSQLLRLKGKKGFEESKWVHFHRAARTQRALVTGWLN